jgi:hypothetical protein
MLSEHKIKSRKWKVASEGVERETFFTLATLKKRYYQLESKYYIAVENLIKKRISQQPVRSRNIFFRFFQL